MASRMDEEREKQNSRVSVDYSRQHKTADRTAKQSSASKTNSAAQRVSPGSTRRSSTESRTGAGKSLVGNYERQHKTVENRPASSVRRSYTNYDSRNEFDPESLVGKSGRYWLAEISKIGENDRETGRELYSLYEQSKTDASSPLYDPYASATNTNPKYIQKNAAQTEKAKTEWQNLQKELSYWAQSDRNYSDEEILNRVNWKNYPTLAKMDADRAGEGSTVYLNEPIGYDQDAMYGVMWAARNPDLATGDATLDAVQGTLGRGKQYQRDEQKAARLDPASKDYNPYLVGSTMDSQLQTYGVNGFGSDWLNQNLQYRGTDDYTKVYKAEQTTKKAEQELTELKQQMDNLLDQGWTPEEVFTDDFLADYSTLQKLQNSIDNGSLIDTTRAIGYDRNAMQEAYQEAYTKRYGTKSNSEYAADTAAAMGASVQQNEAQTMVDDANDKKQKEHYQTIMQNGTVPEKTSVKIGTGTAGYNRTVEQVEAGIQSGTAGAEGTAASKQLTVSQKTAPKYFEAMDAVKNGVEPDYSDELTAILNKAGVDAGEEDYTAKVAASLSQKAAEGDQEAAIMLNDWNNVGIEEYWEKQDNAETASAYQAELESIRQQWKDAFGDDTPEYRSHVNTMETIYSFKDAPKNDWSAYDVVTLLNQQDEENGSQVTASARALNQQKIEYIDQLLENADQYGVPKNYLENMQATREQLERANNLIDSHEWQNNTDYHQNVEAFDQAEWIIDFWTLSGKDEEIAAAIKDPEAANAYLNSPMNNALALSKTSPDLFYTAEMTEEERNNFKYLFASQGQENAMAYYDDLRPMLAARYAAGESEAAQELGEKLPVTGTVLSILGSLAQMEGSIYTTYMALTGQQADPNSMAFSANRMVSGTRQGTKERVDEMLGGNEFAKNAFHFVYDAMTSAGDSLMSAAAGSLMPALGAAEGASQGMQLLAKGSQLAAKNAGLVMMSTVAASNATQEALLKGADSETALLAGLASFIAEASTEKIPFDNITELYQAGNTGGKIMKLLADNIIGEGIGEGMSEYLGAAGDYLTMGDDSDFIQSVNDYRADGMSEEAAIHQVVSELNQQALYATLSGAFSGVVSSGGSYAAGRLMNRVESRSGNTPVSNDVVQQTAENTVAEQGEGQQNEAAQAASDTVSEEGARLVIRDAEGNVMEERNQPAQQANQTEENALTALYTAQQNGVGEVQKTASVDAALRSFGMEPETSVAVSKRIVETESTEKATAILEAAPNRQKAAQAISMAVLSPNSETAAVFADLNGQITAEDVNGLTQMYELDRLDDGAMGAYEAAIEESQLADETMAVLSQMDNGRVESARESAAKAQQAADQSGAKLEAANAGLEAAQASLETARQRRNENLNPETIAAESKALQQYGKAQETRETAEAQYRADSKALEDAKGKVTAAQEEAVIQARAVALEQQKARQEARQEASIDENSILQPEADRTSEHVEETIPSGGEPGTNESQFAVKTGQNTSVLTDETKQKLRESPYYQKVSQKGSVDRAIDKVEKEGYEARKYRMLMGVTDILTPDGQTEAYVLSQIAKENGDTEGQAAIAFKVKESGTLLAQSLAMRSLYTEMTPEAKANYVQKLVDQINDQYEGRGKDTRVSVPDWLEQSLQDAGDNETKQSEVLDRAYREIAAQMPYSVTDTLNTWRFLSMLGNPMTHIKNVLANTAFMPYVAVKNRVAAGIEAGVSQVQKLMGRETIERSKSFAPLKSEYRTFAKEICRQSEDILSGNEKANKANGKSKIDEYRQKAPSLIDKLSKKNRDFLGAEDLMAKNHYFRYALASYLQANKADLTNLSDGMLERATQYAVDEAYKNTFNNVNQFAKWLSKTERELSTSQNPVAKAAGILLEGTVPFKNTPANIVSRGVEYSPAGLANAIFLNYRKLKSGTDYQGNAFTMQNYIDGIASGLTGTAAVAMGALLASCGVLDLGDDEDDEVRGKNKNSVNVAGYNVGIDWSGVAAMPLLMGANLYERWSEKNGEPLSLSDFLNSVKSIADPVMDLSMVQGVTALLDTASYSDNALGTMGTKMATSYLGQFTPTVLGAITRTFFDDTRRTTYTDKNSDLSSETQYLLQSMRNKIPGLSKQGMAYLDAWGNEQQTDSLLERFLTNFVLPGYAKKIKTDDEVTEALLEMYDEYGDSGYLPTKAKKYFNVNGEKYNLSQEEYTKYAKNRGIIAHELLGALMQNESYQSAAPEFQLDAITDVWKYASQTAAYGINEGFKRDSWVASTRDPEETILEKMDTRIQTAEKDKFKASFFDAFDAGDVRSMKMCAAGLEEYGYQASSLRSACKAQYQAQYKELYESGDYEGMREMRDRLLAAGIGFKVTDFDKWLENGKK